jgi:hypothetical protein
MSSQIDRKCSASDGHPHGENLYSGFRDSRWFDSGHERSLSQAAKRYRVDCASHSPELRSVETTAAVNDYSLVRADDATAAAPQSAKLAEVKIADGVQRSYAWMRRRCDQGRLAERRAEMITCCPLKPSLPSATQDRTYKPKLSLILLIVAAEGDLAARRLR